MLPKLISITLSIFRLFCTCLYELASSLFLILSTHPYLSRSLRKRCWLGCFCEASWYKLVFSSLCNSFLLICCSNFVMRIDFVCFYFFSVYWLFWRSTKHYFPFRPFSPSFLSFFLSTWTYWQYWKKTLNQISRPSSFFLSTQTARLVLIFFYVRSL